MNTNLLTRDNVSMYLAKCGQNTKIYGRDTEIHLELNPNRRFKYSTVASEAIGYIRGVCQIEAKLKPQAWAASFAADRFESLKLAA